mmetsp:Transcript_102221/g.234316  ORF Transcript_102221/g.234316 Transcript_102221/m.234316 type:complete len:151 (+) Transcript_102221:1191-1643(+)
MADTLKAKLSAPLLEAVQRQLPEVDRANERSKLSSEDVAGIARILAHDNHEGRKKFDTDVLLKPIFRPYFDLTLDEQREKSLQMLLAACEAGVVSVRDFERNPMNIFMVCEWWSSEHLWPSRPTRSWLKFSTVRWPRSSRCSSICSVAQF